jgi:hypothetical protein
LVNITDFLNDGDASKVENQVISRELNEKEHFKIISKERWEMLVEGYGGGPAIAKPEITEGSGYNSRKVVEVYYRKVWLFLI